MRQRIIGLSGLAGAGKDFFLQELQRQDPRFHRFALADKLKEELNPHLQSLYGVDIFTCSREMKNKVRPILVEHGKIRRADSKGTHWTEILKHQIASFAEKKPQSYVCVTDIRYDVFPEDEVHWLKEQMGGILVHIRKYKTELYPDAMPVWKYDTAPNADEAENDPKVRAKADYRIEWPHVTKPDGSVDSEKITPYVTDFINFLQR